MGQITKIEQQKNKNRVNIFIDNDFFCGLEKETAITFGLKVGKTIDEDKLNQAILASEQKRAFEKALDYLAVRIHTKYELTTKLYGKGFNSDAISGAILKLEEYNYIDDRKFAEEFKNQNCKYSKQVLKNKLLQKGVSNEIISEVLKNFDVEDEIELCKNFAEKYLKSKKINSISDKQKMIASLSRKGFKFSTISTVLNLLKISDYGDFDES